MALDCPEQNYEQIIKRMDLLLDEYNKTHRNPWMLGYSAGMASSSQEGDFDIDTLLKLADQALYKVKEEKRKISG